MTMKVSSIKYQFCALVDLVRYDAFDIKDARGLEAMVQMHLDSGPLLLELYMEFSRSNEGFATSTSFPIPEARTIENVDSPTTLLESSHYDILEPSMGRHSSVLTLDFNRGRQNIELSSFDGRIKYMAPGMVATFSGWQLTCDFECFNTYTRREGIVPMTFTGKGTSNTVNIGKPKNEDDNKFNVDPPRGHSVDVSEVAFFLNQSLF
ncbi:hypothetical protein J1N35_000679 [Gossypium stocksii]|uniref:Uncharacterized protein n=1 Tax=Gossypium stocksii TaxID=47602 RepID=A0A9D4AKQ9_9ROSI|nr:hypothetical protein J1N35_000679 [Gossypium stocksii]